MKIVDTIYRSKRIPGPQNQPSRLPPPSAVAPPKKPFYYFYKSLQVVLSFWIVTILAIMTQPWLDYWVKSTIKKNTSPQVLSESITDKSRIVTEKSIEEETVFNLKNTKVDISAPIVEGVGSDSLKNGIGHHPDSVWPDEKGNIVLAGHNFDLDAENPYGQVFISLRLVEIGDEVTIDYRGKEYTYEVYKKETINPKDTSLFGQSDEWMLTFYTCDPPYTDWKRLVFQAKLVKME
ncbi:MAG: sortase family protein [Candidatus Berkelbacteria bacterium]|nr:sortase family protein [Candidatus Berkelbacteria bacterium]